MSKKNFKTPFDTLLGEENTKNRSVHSHKVIRATFLVNPEYHEKLKAISYWERKQIKDVLDDALSNYFKTYEATKGTIQLPKLPE